MAGLWIPPATLVQRATRSRSAPLIEPLADPIQSPHPRTLPPPCLVWSIRLPWPAWPATRQPLPAAQSPAEPRAGWRGRGRAWSDAAGAWGLYYGTTAQRCVRSGQDVHRAAHTASPAVAPRQAPRLRGAHAQPWPRGTAVAQQRSSAYRRDRDWQRAPGRSKAPWRASIGITAGHERAGKIPKKKIIIGISIH